MLRCQILAVAHFVFGGKTSFMQRTCDRYLQFYIVLYAVGIVELELESTSAFVLLLFVIPLAFTLSGFLIWILYALNGKLTSCASLRKIHSLSSHDPAADSAQAALQALDVHLALPHTTHHGPRHPFVLCSVVFRILWTTC